MPQQQATVPRHLVQQLQPPTSSWRIPMFARCTKYRQMKDFFYGSKSGALWKMLEVNNGRPASSSSAQTIIKLEGNNIAVHQN